MSLDKFPSEIVWRIEIIQYLGSTPVPSTLPASCRGCYDDNDRFGRAMVTESVCLPKDTQRCVRLTFQDRRGLEQNSEFTAYLDGGEIASYMVNSNAPANYF